MECELKNKKVFVSASSDGIGKAIANSFLEEGAVVMINGRNESKLRKVQCALNNKHSGNRCFSYVGDMSDSKVITRLPEYIRGFWDKLDVLVCNLGSGKGLVDDKYDIEEWKRLMNINLFDTVNTINVCLPLLRKSKESSIVCLSSLVAFDKIGAPPAYAASKAGINSFVKYLSDDMAQYGVRVNAIAPGNVYYEGGRWQELRDADTMGIDAYINENVPLKRFGKPEEIADAVIFMASKRASFITGTVLKVDGGQSRGY